MAFEDVPAPEESPQCQLGDLMHTERPPPPPPSASRAPPLLVEPRARTTRACADVGRLPALCLRSPFAEAVLEGEVSLTCHRREHLLGAAVGGLLAVRVGTRRECSGSAHSNGAPHSLITPAAHARWHSMLAGSVLVGRTRSKEDWALELGAAEVERRAGLAFPDLDPWLTELVAPQWWAAPIRAVSPDWRGLQWVDVPRALLRAAGERISARFSVGARVLVKFDDGVEYLGTVRAIVAGEGDGPMHLYSVYFDDGDELDDVHEDEIRSLAYTKHAQPVGKHAQPVGMHAQPVGMHAQPRVAKHAQPVTKHAQHVTKPFGKPVGTDSMDAQQVPAASSSSGGNELVGARVEVYWPDDDTWYAANVSAHDAVECTHTVTYEDDGVIEKLKLVDEAWRVATCGARKRRAPEALEADSAPTKRAKSKAAAKSTPPAGPSLADWPSLVAASHSDAPQPADDRVTEAEGLRLFLTREKLHNAGTQRNPTGYTGVRESAGGRFRAEGSRAGRSMHLGCFNSVVEAAVAFARYMQARGVTHSEKARPSRVTGGDNGSGIDRVTEVDGLQLHLAPVHAPVQHLSSAPFDGGDDERGRRKSRRRGCTGYRGVRALRSGRFRTEHKHKHLGVFDTPVAAAVAYAKHVQSIGVGLQDSDTSVAWSIVGDDMDKVDVPMVEEEEDDDKEEEEEEDDDDDDEDKEEEEDEEEEDDASDNEEAEEEAGLQGRVANSDGRRSKGLKRRRTLSSKRRWTREDEASMMRALEQARSTYRGASVCWAEVARLMGGDRTADGIRQRWCACRTKSRSTPQPLQSADSQQPMAIVHIHQRLPNCVYPPLRAPRPLRNVMEQRAMMNAQLSRLGDRSQDGDVEGGTEGTVGGGVLECGHATPALVAAHEDEHPKSPLPLRTPQPRTTSSRINEPSPSGGGNESSPAHRQRRAAVRERRACASRGGLTAYDELVELWRVDGIQLMYPQVALAGVGDSLDPYSPHKQLVRQATDGGPKQSALLGALTLQEANDLARGLGFDEL